MSNELLFAFCAVLNSALLVIWFLLWYEADLGKVRSAFFMTMLGYAVWMDSVLLFRMDFWSESVAILFSRLAFTGGAVATLAIGQFLLELSEYRERRKWLLYVFRGLLVVAAISPFSGLIENGIGVEGGLRKPLYGPLHPYYTGALLAGGLYFFASAYLGYKRVQRELLHFQLRRILYFSIVAFVGSAFTNALAPAITGSSAYSVLGIFWPVGLMGAMAHLLIQGRTMLTLNALREMLHERVFRHDENLFGVRRYLEALRFAVVDCPPTFDRTIKLVDEQLNLVAIHVLKDAEAELTMRPVSALTRAPGLLNTMADLERENKRLTFALLQAEAVLGGTRQEITESFKREPLNMRLDEPSGLTPLEQSERRTILEYLQANNFNQAVTSRQIGIRQNTMIVKMRKYGIKAPEGLVRPGRRPKGFHGQNVTGVQAEEEAIVRDSGRPKKTTGEQGGSAR